MEQYPVLTVFTALNSDFQNSSLNKQIYFYTIANARGEYRDESYFLQIKEPVRNGKALFVLEISFGTEIMFILFPLFLFCSYIHA